MNYADGPLEVIRPATDYIFLHELGQGARGYLHASADLEKGVEALITEVRKPAAVMEALLALREVGDSVGWDWEQIVRRTKDPARTDTSR